MAANTNYVTNNYYEPSLFAPTTIVVQREGKFEKTLAFHFLY